MVNEKLYELFQRNDFNVVRNQHKEIKNVYLFLSLYEVEDFGDVAAPYIDSMEDGIEMILREGYIVVDVYDFIVEWIEGDINDYIDFEHVCDCTIWEEI